MKKTMMLLCIALFFYLPFCHSMSKKQETPARLLAHITASDGINKREATNIAKAYFLRHVDCGSFMSISEVKNAWVVNGAHGFGAEPIEGFFIAKRNGAITSPIGPSYKRPQDLLNQ
jgi:hypothetical protein